MKRALFLVLLSLPFIVSAQNFQKNFIDQNYVEVNGRAEMKVVPDQIDIQIIINEGEGKGKQTLEELEKEMTGVLTGLGIDIEKDLVVKDLASNFKNFLFLNTDIRLSKEYVLTVDAAMTAARVFLGLQKIGISNMNITKLDHSEMERYRQEVKIAATKAARKKAQALATAVDQEIGRALYIQEFGPVLRQATPSNMMVRAEASGISQYQSGQTDALPDMEFEAIELESTIMVRFELK